MANRYDIIHIDFQASARGANAAIESIRQEADKCNTRISELKKNIAEAPKDTDAKILEGWNQELKVTDRRYRQLVQAQKELMKGMRALDEGVKMFNDGSLSAMNAAFQKQVNNAAKLAQSKLTTGTKEWRDMGALMQETEQNYARMMRDTDQLIESLKNGGTVFRKTLEDEKKGLQDLLQVLPYMGTEYRKAEEQLKFLVKTTDEMAIKERQLKGEIVTTDDARRVSLQLTKEGAEAARQRVAAADVEIEKGKQEIETLEKEREEREKNARLSAQAAAEYRENQRMHEDEIERLQREIKAEEERAASGRTGVEAMRRKAEAAGKAADKEIEAQKKLDAEYETAKGKFMALREEYEKMKQTGAAAPVKDAAASAEKSIAEETTEASKKKTEAKKEETAATKETTAAKKEESKAEEQVIDEEKKESLSVEELIRKAKALREESLALLEERKKLEIEQNSGIKTINEEAAAVEKEANAFANLTKEQAQALLQQKQMASTISKGAENKFAYSNPEEAQYFLIESMRQANPANAKSNTLSLNKEGVAKVKGMFMERYGIQDDTDAIHAMRGLLSGNHGRLLDMGMINDAFSRVDLNPAKVSAYAKEIKDLTAVVNGETEATKEGTKAVEENAKAKRTLADVDAEYEATTKEVREIMILVHKMQDGEVSTTEKLADKTGKLAESHKKNAEAIKEEIDAIKQMNREQAEAMKKELTAPSAIGYKAGKLDASNLEEVQHFLLTQISKKGTVGKDGTYSLAGQNVDNLLTAFQNKYGLSGKKQEAKQILKELASGKSGGLFQEGGIIDFNNETMLIKANTEAYQARIQKLKALIDITNGTAQAVGKSTEATKKDTEATLSQTDAIKAQEEEVKRRRTAFEKKNEDYEAKNAKLREMRSALGRLPKSGPDALLARQQAQDEIDEYNENIVKPARADKTKLKGLWEKSVKDLLKMQGQDTEETKKNTEAENQNAEATEKSAKGKRGKAKASEDSTKATKEETQQSAELLAKEKEMKEAEAEMVAAMERGEAQQKKTNKAVEDAETANEKAKQSEVDLVKSLDEKSQKLKENKEGLENLNKANKDTIATNEKNQQLLAETNGKIQEQGEKIRDAERIKAQAKTDGIEKTEQAIRLLTEENRHIDQNSFTWKRNTIEIQHLQEALDEMKGKPALMMMEQRMKNIGALSASALEETRRFWDTMAAGAEKGSEKLATAEANVKALVEEEQKRNEAQAGKVIGDMGSYSDKEIAEAVKSFEQLRDAQTHGNEEWTKFNNLVQQGKQHLEELAKADALAKMEERMSNLTNLSDAALAETKKYWEALKAGAEQGSEDLTKAETNLTRIIDLEKERTRIENERKAQIVRGGSLNMYSEAEITEAIKAAKELHSHMASADPAAQKLAESIAKAEAHIRQYGIEAARTAQRQEELDATMQKQFQTMINGMRSGVMPSQAAVKSQMNYWQKLIDDPKTAAESLQFYRDQLAEVKKMYDFMIKSQGESALTWFQQGSDKDASGNQIKEMADKLKEYRGTLLKETNADEIAQIDAILQRIGASAKKATEELMDFEKAKELALQAGDDVYGKNNPAFLASPEEIQAATKSIEKYREELFKTIKQKKDMGEATDDEEAELQELAKYLKDLKFEQDNFNMSREKMEALMKTPVNATSIDELRSAIKRADGELKRMEGSLGQNNAQYKAFAEQVRNAKNMLKEMEGQAKASATAWEKAWSRLKTYVVMYMGFNAVWQKMVGTADDIMQLSDKMGEVRKTTGFTADEVGRLSDNLKRLDVRTPLTQLMEISAKAGQLGLKTEQDVMGFTEAANKLMIALPEMGAEAATEMMKVALATGEVKKIQDQLNQGIVEGSSATEVTLSKIGSTIDQLRANSAAAAPQITDFVKRVGAVGAQSGITIDQVAALGATVDAVGLRVEMSATALSRMIPAIRNNAFEVAKAIGMTPNALREMFDEAGGGMEAMLAIFQHIKDSGMDEDSIEKMLGIGNMQDVMKQLNQQGARAGIVFAGLSQNVDELRRNLGVAKEAYEDNIAILQEYNKMNDTTAAKWERFKNQLEEFFVGDFTQRFLGGLITGMRAILDMLTGNNGWSAALRTIGVYLLAIKLNIAGIFSGVKNISFSLKGIAMAIGLIDKETKKLAWGNIFTAAAAAILWVVLELKNLKSALDKASESLGKTKEEVNRSIDRFEGYWAKLKSTNEALIQAKASHEKLSAEVDKLRKSTDGSAESTANLKKKEDELTTSEKNVTKASNDHKSAIAQMNSIYGKYLGFILTETNYSNLAAAAHDKVTAAIEREMLMKQRQAAIGEVDSNYSDNIATGYGDLNERLVQYGKLSRSEAAKAMGDMQRFMRENLKYDAGTNATVASKAIMDQLKKSRLDVSKADANEIAGLWFDQYLKENYHLSDNVRRVLTGVERRSDQKEGWANVYTPFATNLRGGYAETYAQREQARGAVSAVYNVDIADSEGREAAASGKLLSNLEKSAQNAKKVILDKNVDEKKRNEAYGELANALEGLDNRINELDPQKDAATIERLNNMAKSLKGEGIDIKKLKQAREKIHQTLFERATFNEEDIRNLDTTNPWGGSHEASSTDWKKMTAEQLVERRKQMNEFVKSIQTDSDVKTVLGEDAALKKAIEKGMSSDMRTVIEWYNTERLKIQDELHARHLTNTGDWMDPKKERGARKQFRDEMDAYLHELDAYYTERKTRIEEAGTDEGLTEAEIKNRTLNNEMEWQQRRAELQKLYSRKQKEVTEEELNAIYHIIAERTGDSENFVKAQIAKTNQFVDSIEKSGEKGAAIVHRWMSQVELDTERSYLKGQQALTKQMRAIEAIIDKERPFNGITKSLQESLATMDILTGEMRKEYNELMKQGGDMAKFNERQNREEMKRTAFLLGEAENAYSTTIDHVMDDMRQKGMTAWADWLSADPKLQEALMAQLRSTYDAIQDAIKKEASQLKKQAEIMWNNILMPDGKTTLKQQTDRIVAQLGLDEGRVKRANSLIGAGQASERVADKLAIQQMKVQLAMQGHYYNLMKKQGQAHVDMLNAQAKAAKERGDEEKATRKTLEAQHAQMSLNLATSKEVTELAKQREDIIARTEESQNRLYTELKSWGDLLASSMQSIFEASNAGNAEYYNERAKLQLQASQPWVEGKNPSEKSTYIVIDNAGTDDAEARYERLTEMEALKMQHEIEQQNAQAEAWKKVMDDINMKISDQITDSLNAMLQKEAIDTNTRAVNSNTEALLKLMGGIDSLDFSDASRLSRDKNGMALDENGQVIAPIQPADVQQPESMPWYMQPLSEEEWAKIQENIGNTWTTYKDSGITAMQEMTDATAEMPSIITSPYPKNDEDLQVMNERIAAAASSKADIEIEADKRATEAKLANQRAVAQGATLNDNQMTASGKNMYAALMSAANLYGVSYQTMTNDNLDASQKFQMIALQAAGQSAMAMLQADMFKSETGALVALPQILAECLKINPLVGTAIFAVLSALVGAAIGTAASNLTKGKSQISQVTGASPSASAGKLTTGMLTYAEGNVNEFTDPGTLTEGRSYNVDAADGHTYRARYMGSNPKTHLTNGPEFHLAGERGREMIIDAGTTRQITMNENEIWHAIKTLSGGGRMTGTRRGRGVRAFAEGNVEDFEDMGTMGDMGSMGFDKDMMAGFQSSLDRNNELLQRALTEGIRGVFNVYGRDGLVDSYDRGKKTLNRHGERY